MPKRSAYPLQLRFEEQVSKRLEVMEVFVSQVQRALQFAKDGSLQDSFNILSTVGGVYDMESIAADFSRNSDFLVDLQDVRDMFVQLDD